MQGPTLPISEEIHRTKYRLDGESFEQCVYRIANALKDGEEHRRALKDILGNMRFLPAGRVQCAIGSPRQTTAYNCFVSGPLEDSMDSIMERAKEAAETMRRGGGIGYDFSLIRPRGDLIQSLDARASGPVSFMAIYDAVCHTIASAGHRRGAQMAVLRVDHPDIERFIRAKQDSSSLRGFNISVAVTDEFMHCLGAGEKFALRWPEDGKVYSFINPAALWDDIMRSNWDWAEPGVLFIDTINRMNNLRYCEIIAATNPCGEQPLPQHGACLLGSFNLVKYLVEAKSMNMLPPGARSPYLFDWPQFQSDIPHIVRALDNVIDRTIYPLEAQKGEALLKRRMGPGVTALANCAEVLGYPYGSQAFLKFEAEILACLANAAYVASAELAKEKGPFPAYNPQYLDSEYLKVLDPWTISQIERWGVRNSHLTSIAPTGTISLTADNVSSGIEPPFRLTYDRTIQEFDGFRTETVEDYAYRVYGVAGRTADQLTAQEHLEVLSVAQEFVDSAVSKTCNVGDDVPYDDFKSLYTQAWRAGCKGLTTFRPAGKRTGILTAREEEADEPAAVACTIDPITGAKTCSD